MILAGIDYSIGCPCLCIHEGEVWDIKNSTFFFLTGTKKYQTEWVGINKSDTTIVGLPNNDDRFYFDAPRFEYRSRVFVNIMKELCVDKVAIENYAMGANGRITGLAEAGGVLKQAIWHSGIPFDLVPPTTVKKSFTGKGNSSKTAMADSFRDQTGIDIWDTLIPDKTKFDSPAEDVVDSFAICKWLFEKEHVGNE